MKFTIGNVSISIGEATTVEEIEAADDRYNALFTARQEDELDELELCMYDKGYLPYFDEDLQTFYFLPEE